MDTKSSWDVCTRRDANNIRNFINSSEASNSRMQASREDSISLDFAKVREKNWRKKL
jgi:hypothetical protein